MGACLGQCFAKFNNPFNYRRTNMPSQEAELVELCNVPDGEEYFAQSGTSTGSGLNSPPQTLDARTLMRHQGCTSSTPASSLDLEWEHEVMPSSEVYNCEVTSPIDSPSYTSINVSQPSSLTASQWSKVSTPNSLEWDPVEADITSIDVETEQFLTEIERLTDRTLKETGDWTGGSS